MKSRHLLLGSLIFFILAMGLYSRGLHFPPFYHPDEINKVIQIQSGERNFHHPQLMLNSAALLNWLGGSPESIMETAALGRWASVFFAATTVALLAYAAGFLAGPVALLACGWILLTTPKLFELAHYMKEDPALVMGFAAIYLAALLYVRRPTVAQAAWLGFAAGLAISAKYIGIYPAVLALLVLIWTNVQVKDWGRQLAVFFIGCLIVVLFANWQAVVQAAQFQYGLGREINLFHEKAVSLINPKIFKDVGNEIHFLAWLALGVWLASPRIRGRRLNAAEWLILVAAFGYALMLIMSSRAASRYLLPLIVSLPFLVVVALCWVGTFTAEKLRKPSWWIQVPLCFGFVLLSAGSDIPGMSKLYTGFQSDTRFQLTEFIRTNIPETAILAEDHQAKLPNAAEPRRNVEGKNLPHQRIYSEENSHLGDEYTLAELRERGATHIVILVDGETGTLLRQPEKAKESQAKLASFLAEVEKETKLIWSCETGTPTYLNPSIRFYQVQP